MSADLVPFIVAAIVASAAVASAAVATTAIARVFQDKQNRAIIRTDTEEARKQVKEGLDRIRAQPKAIAEASALLHLTQPNRNSSD